MGLEGRGTFLTMQQGKEVLFDLAPGQVLFLARYTWICPVPRAPYRSLGVVRQAPRGNATFYHLNDSSL